MALSSWDDYPVHQTSEFIRHAATSDRNFYDRYYFNMHGSSDELFAIFGLGQYPNLGVTDFFIDAAYKGKQHIVRASKPLEDRMDLKVGPLAVEVIEPLEVVRVTCDETEHTVAMDVTWTGAMPAKEEPRQYLRSEGKVIFDTQRFAQTGTWEGWIAIDGERIAVTPDRWKGTRDRSWGIRPVGEADPDGRRSGVPSMKGMWNYFPMQFDDHSILYINNEHEDGYRELEESVRVWHEDGRQEWLGTPSWDHKMVPGTRVLESSVITFPDAPEGAIEVSCRPLMVNWLSIGSGYGMDADWKHGMWQGPEEVVQGLVLEAEDIKGMAQFGVVDHVGEYSYGDNVGYGLYEHAFIGSFPGVGIDGPTEMAK